MPEPFDTEITEPANQEKQKDIPLVEIFPSASDIDIKTLNIQAVGEFRFFQKRHQEPVLVKIPVGKQQKETRTAIGTIENEKLTLITQNHKQAQRILEYLHRQHSLLPDQINFLDIKGEKIDLPAKKEVTAQKTKPQESRTRIHESSTLTEPDLREIIDIQQQFETLREKFSRYTKTEGILYKETEMKKEQELANQVLEALAKTLLSSTEICLSKKSPEYGSSAEVFLALVEIIDKIGTNSLGLKRNVELELEYTNNGEEEIYLFNSKDIPLSDGRTVEWLNILVRPNDLLGTKSGNVKEVLAQARTKIQYKLRGSVGVANIRIDPPDPRLQNNVVIDLEIKQNRYSKVNQVDKLKLNQQAGHHFNSGVNIADFGDRTPADIHRAIANRLNQLSILE